ncbi:hypothetical protein DNTS_021516 [Danionella cerebrum]|uniref:G-protein coupled receptors family 1 profile domain-containing protein n=1 Tax=Danionella cerebrum TaxID=2873325 RepID=A0A553QI77_9TELE|nr:hypothetical protein DNTS_021516 [Danionella translucida]
MAEAETVVYTLLEVVLALGCSTGNLLVVLAVCTSRALRETTFCFVVSLAVADLLVGCVVIPLALLVDGRIGMSFHSCLFISCVVIVVTQVSVHSLLAIAVDRYLRVYNPLRYRKAVKKQHLWVAVTVCWISATLLGLLPMFGWHKKNPTTPQNSTMICKFMDVISMSYMVNFVFFACVIPPIIIMTLLYLHLFIIISKQLKKGIGCATETRSFYYKERKLANSLSLVLALFAVSWVPLHIMNALFHYRIARIPKVAFHIGILLLHANSAANPIVYAFKVPKIRMAYKRLLRRLTCSEMKAEPASQTMDNNVSTNSNSNACGIVKKGQQVVFDISQESISAI